MNIDISDTNSEDLFEHYHFTADTNQELLRIDKFLTDRLPNTSRNKVQNLVNNDNVLVNQKTVKVNHKVHPGDEITVMLEHPKRDSTIEPENIPLDIVFEDDDLLIINKPAGLVVHPGFGNYSGTLVNALVYHFGQLPSQNNFEPRPGLVHRLDKDTSGIMVIAKSEEALIALSKMFFDRTIDRRYIALVWGDLEEDGTIEGNIGRSLKDRKVMSVFPDGEYGKHAITHYKIIKRYGYVTLVECKLETGRTHQIRAHFKYIGHPLFSDATYGGDKIMKGTTFTKYKQFVNNCFKILPRQALYAKSLAFKHPTTGKQVNFDSELAADIQEVLDKWEIYVQSKKE